MIQIGGVDIPVYPDSLFPLGQTALVWGAPGWLGVAIVAAIVMLAILVIGYWKSGASPGVRAIAFALKATGIAILILCLLEPLLGGKRARPGANQFALLADNSQSMTLKDEDGKTRGESLKALVGKDVPWLNQLARDFDLRQYAFDTQLKGIESMEVLAFDGRSSDLAASIERLLRRYQNRPLAGVILLTDGSATDAAAIDKALARKEGLPPIYPVVMGASGPAADISLEQLAVSQTNFEDAPVTLTANITTSGHKGDTLIAELLDESGKSVEKQKIRVEQDGQPLAVRFKTKPDKPGLSFYKVRVAEEGKLDQFDKPEKSSEATLANNTRLAAVDRGKGPYSILYVSGRPNWEFKFLNRSLKSDDQVRLVALVRLAKREPKFAFLGRAGESSNPLFRGFDNTDKDKTESYDQPVIKAIGPLKDGELSGGFPKSALELYNYHALILDDVESEYFSQDQLQLVKDFVRQRGGGLLMLGGTETFKNGKYERTQIGDLLPVYADQAPTLPENASFKLVLAREGWLEPWVRLRSEEDAERKRLEAMPAFAVLNPVRGIKPGATVLARVKIDGGDEVPALVEQRFGQGRVGALLIGDLWRWGLRRAENGELDMEKAWRQTIRWLVADVPQRVDVTIEPSEETGGVTLGVQVRDTSYLAMDNSTVTVKVTGPDGKSVDIRADASTKTPGRYEAAYVPRMPGAYRANVTALAADGSEAGIAQAGWTSDPAAEEFRELSPNTALMESIARRTGGQVVKASDLADFAAGLPTRNAQITEPYVKPLWHQSWVFALAIACLAAEWGLRRLKGLP